MIADLSNSERLARLYDPAYVHRVETINGGLPVRVCIEGRMLKDQEGTGVSVYARMLMQCLGEAGAEALVLGDGDDPRPRALRWLAATRRNPRLATAPIDAPEAPTVPDLFREAQVFFNLHGRTLPVAFEEPPLLMHWTYPVPLHVIGARNLYTIHDLIPLTHPELTPIPQERHGRVLRAILAQADWLVTVTEAMRSDIVARLGVDPARVVSTWQAVDAPLQADPPLPEGLRTGRYFLFCGRIERRKNLAALAQAHAMSGCMLPLVVVGPRVPGEDALEEALAAFPGVRRLAFLPRRHLLGLMRRARALLFPTLAEGFGLPIVEAMTLGCPVMTSDRGATAEVAGGAALLVEPESIPAIAEAIRLLDRDDALCGRLRASGFARARAFTPERYARRLRALYAGVLESLDFAGTGALTFAPDMRVGIDGFNLARPHGTGVATYAHTLAAAMRGLGRRIDLVYGLKVDPASAQTQRETLFYAALAEGRSGEEPPNKVTAWGRVRRSFLNPAARDLVEVQSSGRVIRQGVADRVPPFDRLFTYHRLFWIGRRYLQRYGRLMPVRMTEPPAIMHWTYPVPVRLVGARNVYTIHDLVPLRLPYLSLEDKAYHERLLGACIAEADHILTVSDMSRADILEWLGAASESVTTIHQAVLRPVAHLAEPEIGARQLRSLFDLEPQGYFLFYGATEPKKNVGRLIEAYLGSSIERPLVIAGPSAWRSEGEVRLLEGAHGKVLARASQIRRIDYLPAEHLGLLLRGARALVFPSLYEGFGLPPVEAMRAGVPVIVGDAGALPEIVAGAGLLVDPYDAGAIAAAMMRLDDDADLRASLIGAGLERAKAFALEPYQTALDRFQRSLLSHPASRPSAVFGVRC